MADTTAMEPGSVTSMNVWSTSISPSGRWIVAKSIDQASGDSVHIMPRNFPRTGKMAVLLDEAELAPEEASEDEDSLPDEGTGGLPSWMTLT